MVVEGIKESTSRNIIFKRRKLECKKRRCEEEEKLSVGNIALIGQREEKRRGRELESRKEDLYPCQLCIDGETVGSVPS